MKYKEGSMWIMTTPENDKFVGEVINFNDDRISRKIKVISDVCMYFNDIKWGTTYDPEFLDKCCVPLKDKP